MAFSIISQGGAPVLLLEGAVLIENAQELARCLCKNVESDVPMGVDTTHLTDIDTCILQFLCSLRKTLPTLHFDSPSEPFLAALDRCGIRRELLGTSEGL